MNFTCVSSKAVHIIVTLTFLKGTGFLFLCFIANDVLRISGYRASSGRTVAVGKIFWGEGHLSGVTEGNQENPITQSTSCRISTF
jgi:hypothetical protein